ncbi:coiled-coil domain-containing protein 175 [Discoglossus pictus]
MSSAMGVPECTAVAAVLEHFMELENQLRLEQPAFDEEDLHHLVAVADYIKELEHARRTTRELLEMETIDNSKLRHKLLHLPGTITKEIEASVSRARESNAFEVEQLQNELRNLTQELEDAEKRQINLEDRNSFLCHQSKTMWTEHQEAVELLNQQMADKAHESIVLNETHNKRKEAQDAVIDFRNRSEDLAEDMIIERQEFEEEKLKLIEEIKELEKRIAAQNMKNLEIKQSLDQLTSTLFDVEEKAESQREIIRNLNDDILLLRASHSRLSKKVDSEKKIGAELTEKRNHLEQNMTTMKANTANEVDSLNEKINELAEKMKSLENLHQDLTEKSTELKQMYKSTREEEDKECAKKQDLSTELAIQVSKDKAVKELELFKFAQEQFISEMNQRTEEGLKKQAALTEEGKILQRNIKICNQQIQTLNVDQRKIDEEYATMKQSLTKEIQSFEEELNELNRNLQSEQDKLKASISVLNETEGTHNTEQQTYEDLTKQAGKQLHIGWEDDDFVCKDFSERDQEILDAIVELINKIINREEKIGSLNEKLQNKFIELASLLEYKTGCQFSVDIQFYSFNKHIMSQM